MAIYIALGSNLGNKEENLHKAIRLLEEKGVTVCRVSDFIITEPYGVTDQPVFLNAVAELKTRKSPLELLYTLLKVEEEMGRKRTRHWGERNIDLDLLLYDDQILDLSELQLPHPDMENREFVLKPLAQLAPKAVYPVSGKTIEEMWEELQRRRT